VTPKAQTELDRTASIAPPASEARLLPLLSRAGYRLIQKGARPAVAIVDLTDPSGPDALASLRHADRTADLAVLGIVGDAHENALHALRAGSDGFVAVGSLEREFDLRLEAVRKLGVDRADHGRKEQDLAALLELTADYAAAQDVSALLHDVTRRLSEELDIDRCALVLLDASRKTGHIVAASDDRAVTNVEIELARYPEIREAARTCRPVVVDNVTSHPLLDEVKEAVTRRGISALAAVPLVVRDKSLGVLLLRASEGTRTFKAREVSFAWTVAHATAIALRNARLLEGLRGQAEKAEAKVAALARYEEFFRHVSDGIAILDEHGAIASLNPAGSEILGLRPEKAKGRLFASFATPLSETGMMEMLASARKGEVCRDIDLDVGAADGRLLVLSAGASSVSADTIILSFRDVSHPRAMERELRKTKEFMEKLIDSSVDAIVAGDLMGRIIVYNKSASRILGYGQAEALESFNVAALYPKGVARQIMRMIRSREHGGPGRLEPTRTEVISKSGERVPVMMTAALIYEHEKAVATVGILTDLREKTKLEAKLTRAQERLEQAEKQAVVVELAGTAAHELNQPLTSIMGYSELLRRKLTTEDPTLKLVDIIYREAERMAEIVRKIGKITRYETKAYVGGTRIVDLERATGEEEPKP
jgi:PAS domain S-box-containing protein